LVPLGVGLVVGASIMVAGLWAGGAFERRPRAATAEERLATPVSTVFVGREAANIDQVAAGLVVLRAGDVDGSGVILRDDGHVLTTADLVQGHERVRVWDLDGTEHQGEVIGVDPDTDVAVVAVRGLAAQGALLGHSDTLAVGDPARALNLQRRGAALVRSGIVAGLGVTVARDDDRNLHGLIGTDIVQPDPIEGAALLDADGAVIGITTGVGDSDALRAVPIDLARVVAHDLIATGGSDHPWLGIEGRDLDPGSAADLGIAGGAELETVLEESPAEEAGLRHADVVTHVGDTEVTSMGDLVTALRHLDPGDRVRLGYLRDGAPHWSAVVLAATG
jgi:S1-C subfamily serine protease